MLWEEGQQQQPLMTGCQQDAALGQAERSSLQRYPRRGQPPHSADGDALVQRPTTSYHCVLSQIPLILQLLENGNI